MPRKEDMSSREALSKIDFKEILFGRQDIFVANWKGVIETKEQIKAWAKGVAALNIPAQTLAGKEIIICPPSTHIGITREIFDSYGLFSFRVGAQDVSQFSKTPENNGTYVAESTAVMLQDIGVEACIVGHSAKRKYSVETNEIVVEKVHRLLENGIIPILCVSDQDPTQLPFYMLDKTIKANTDKIIFVYEPPGDISGGGAYKELNIPKITSGAEEMVRTIGGKPVLIYGASISETTADELAKISNIYGGLSGQASTIPAQVAAILQKWERKKAALV
jgi:triosephosphate isomerase (TIM)